MVFVALLSANSWNSHFVIEFVSIFAVFTLLCTSQQSLVSQAVWAGLWQLFPWVCWSLSYFRVAFSTLVFCCSKQKHIRSVGRHVGITFCAKDIPSIRCLQQHMRKSWAPVTQISYQSVIQSSKNHHHMTLGFSLVSWFDWVETKVIFIM